MDTPPPLAIRLTLRPRNPSDQSSASNVNVPPFRPVAVPHPHTYTVRPKSLVVGAHGLSASLTASKLARHIQHPNDPSAQYSSKKILPYPSFVSSAPSLLSLVVGACLKNIRILDPHLSGRVLHESYRNPHPHRPLPRPAGTCTTWWCGCICLCTEVYNSSLFVSMDRIPGRK